MIPLCNAINAVTVAWNNLLVTYFIAPIGVLLFGDWVRHGDEQADHGYLLKGLYIGFGRVFPHADKLGSFVYIGGLLSLVAMFAYVGQN